MKTSKLDSLAYSEAVKYLETATPEGVTSEIIESYTSPPEREVGMTINDIYSRLLESAQNTGQKSGVIGKAIGGFEKLRPVLCDFSPSLVLETYSDRPEELLKAIVEDLEPNGKINSSKNGIWPKYCKTILASAEFLNEFGGVDEFVNWADYLYADKRSLEAIPLVISGRIEGIGYALACDFLKELGYSDYGKPDVHIIEIFEALGLVKASSSVLQIQGAITRISRNVDVTPYGVDKVFWLIGSGNFYNHPQIGNEGRIGSLKNKYISHMLPILEKYLSDEG